MKILLVSWSVLPRPGGSSVIVEQLARNFNAQELIVLGGKDWSEPKMVRDERSPCFLYSFTEFHFLGRGHRFFAGLRKWRFNPLVEEIKTVIREEKIDYVIGVYPDDFYCYAACKAAKSTGVPFSSYFHNTYVENTAIRDPEANKVQTEIFANSEFVFVMSKGMQRFYEEKYRLPRVIPLVHTFNDFPAENTLSGIPGSGKKQYKLVAIGNFNESNMEATIRFARAVGHDNRFTLSLYTHVPKLLLQKRGLDTRLIEHKGFVSPDQVHQILQHYDIAVLTHGFTGGYGEVEYRTIFPTRTIPLLLSGKPIIAHSPAGSFLNDFIRENQCAALVDQAEAHAIIRGLERIIDDEEYQQVLVDNARLAAQQFYGPEVVQNLKNVLQHSKKAV
jgi:glycosyltransferase involved in cell wall biosynthesis